MPYYCAGWGTTGKPHFVEDPLVPLSEGAFCRSCAAVRERAHRRSRVLELVRGRPVLLLDPDGKEPRRTREPHHGTLATTLARTADPDRLAELLERHPDAPLELAVSDVGASLFIADTVVNRKPKETTRAAA